MLSLSCEQDECLSSPNDILADSGLDISARQGCTSVQASNPHLGPTPTKEEDKQTALGRSTALDAERLPSHCLMLGAFLNFWLLATVAEP